MQNFKKGLLVFTSLLVVGLVGMGVYYLLAFNKAKKSVDQNVNLILPANSNQAVYIPTTTVTEIDPIKTSDRVKKILNKAVYHPAVSTDGNYVYYYSSEKNKLVKVDLTTQEEKILTPVDNLINVTHVEWSSDFNRAIVLTQTLDESEVLGGIEVKVYDFISGQNYSLETDQSAWLSADQIIYYLDGAIYQKIYNQSSAEKIIDLPASDAISFIKSFSSQTYLISGTTFYLVDLPSKTKQTIATSVSNAYFSANQTQMILETFNQDNQKNYSLYENNKKVKDLAIKPLGGIIYWPADSNDFFYYILGEEKSIDDNFYLVPKEIDRYNLSSDQTQNSVDLTIEQPALNEYFFQNNKFYFTDNLADQLFSIDLK